MPKKERNLSNIAIAYTVYEQLNPVDSPMLTPSEFLDCCETNIDLFLLGGLDKTPDEIELENADEALKDGVAKRALEHGFKYAKQILADEEKMQDFLQRLEKKLDDVPGVGEKLSKIAVLAEMVIAYASGNYKDIPFASIVAAVSAVAYFVLPVDLIPDALPIAGLTDDAAVALVCWKMIEKDINDFIEWRDAQDKKDEE